MENNEQISRIASKIVAGNSLQQGIIKNVARSLAADFKRQIFNKAVELDDDDHFNPADDDNRFKSVVQDTKKALEKAVAELLK